MRWVKGLLITATGIAVAPSLQAQHYNAWFRGTVSVPVRKKIKIDTEMQYRRQNGFGNENMLDKDLMFTFRNWVHYQWSDDLKFSISPFSRFTHYKIIQSKADETAEPKGETRFSAAVELQNKISPKAYFVEKAALEYRVFGKPLPGITRYRMRWGFRYDFTEKLKWGVYHELLLNLRGIPFDHFFDHYRLGLSLEYKVFPNLKAEIGCLHITRLPINSVYKQYEKNTHLNLVYHLKNKRKSRTINTE